ncbi:MAG: 2-C-methyl-D-erythritol 4-phosphate cytidylyltransferase [Actinobacteria bacterium]|nr:2-C-methyl-D-erythritol 4-phosphate cytidylyltransferase [Actinomycetota bacterium]
MTRESVVLVAAGAGERLGAAASGPKALVTVAGTTLLELALRGLRDAGVRDIVVVHTPGHARAFADVARRHAVTRLVPGGETRTASVRAGLDEVELATEVVAVHDAARALTPATVIRAVLDAVRGDVVAVAPALAVPDTLKRVVAGEVVATVDRSDLQAVHTPQAFVPDVLREALAGADDATDDLGLVERAIAEGRVQGRIALVAGSPRDLKITYPEDLDLVASLLAADRLGPAP